MVRAPCVTVRRVSPPGDDGGGGPGQSHGSRTEQSQTARRRQEGPAETRPAGPQRRQPPRAAQGHRRQDRQGPSGSPVATTTNRKTHARDTAQTNRIAAAPHAATKRRATDLGTTSRARCADNTGPSASPSERQRHTRCQ